MSYHYQLYGPNKEEVNFESPTMLTRNQAREQAAELLNCRVGPIADAQRESNSYPWRVTLANGQEVTFSANEVLSEQQAIDFAIDLYDCRALIKSTNATFKLNSAESLPSSRIEAPITSLEGQTGIDFTEANVIAGWLTAGIFFWLMLIKIQNISTGGGKFSYTLFVLLSAALYGVVMSALYASYSVGFSGGANSPYSQYPSLLIQDTVEVLIPLLLALLSHLGARRIVKNCEVVEKDPLSDD